MILARNFTAVLRATPVTSIDQGSTRRAEKPLAPAKAGAAPSASLQRRADSLSARLSSPSDSGRDLFLHGEPARPPVGFAGHTNRCAAGSGSAGARSRAIPHGAWVVLPNHMHRLRTPVQARGGLLQGDADFPGRWRAIKKRFSKSVQIGEPRSPVMIGRGERGIWQRRYWEHTIRDDRDFAVHRDYTHFNPVKHGLAGKAWLVENPAQWPYSCFVAVWRVGCTRRGGSAAEASRQKRVSGNKSRRPRRAQTEHLIPDRHIGPQPATQTTV